MSFKYTWAGGSVEVLESDSGFDLRCPADLEAKLAEFANNGGPRREIGVKPEAFRLLLSCLDGLSFATDSQLRAECERRGMHFERAPMSELRKDLAEARKDARTFEGYLEGYVDLAKKHGLNTNSCFESIDAALSERDEWKRRAEAAEAKLSKTVAIDWADARDMSGGGLIYRASHWDGGCKVCFAPPGASCTKECDDNSVPNDKVRPWSQRESGPGIAAKPVDEGHYIDPLDLLADDE